jgi:hypothetical protein
VANYLLIDIPKIWRYESTDLWRAAQELACLAGQSELEVEIDCNSHIRKFCPLRMSGSGHYVPRLLWTCTWGSEWYMPPSQQRHFPRSNGPRWRSQKSLLDRKREHCTYTRDGKLQVDSTAGIGTHQTAANALRD